MHKKALRMGAAVAFLLMGTSTASQATQYSGVNNVSFTQAQYNKAFAGNGFLIKYQNKVYGVTVKHALLEAKTPEMNHVQIKDHVTSWKIHPKQAPNKSITFGKLLNSAAEEKLDMAILQKDWLVFEIKENLSDLQVLTLRDTPLKEGETLTAYGCAYVNSETCQQDVYEGKYISMEPHNLRIAMSDWQPGQLRGLSGSPVLDSEQQLVGIVSNVLPAKSGKGFDFAPANLDYLREVLASL